MRYSKPKIEETRCPISFFLTQNILIDSLEFLVGDVYAGQTNSSGNSNNSGPAGCDDNTNESSGCDSSGSGGSEDDG